MLKFIRINNTTVILRGSGWHLSVTLVESIYLKGTSPVFFISDIKYHVKNMNICWYTIFSTWWEVTRMMCVRINFDFPSWNRKTTDGGIVRSCVRITIVVIIALFKFEKRFTDLSIWSSLKFHFCPTKFCHFCPTKCCHFCPTKKLN